MSELVWWLCEYPDLLDIVMVYKRWLDKVLFRKYILNGMFGFYRIHWVTATREVWRMRGKFVYIDFLELYYIKYSTIYKPTLIHHRKKRIGKYFVSLKPLKCNNCTCFLKYHIPI